jgi:N-acetylneuraminic acid mutarotase
MVSIPNPHFRAAAHPANPLRMVLIGISLCAMLAIPSVAQPDTWKEGAPMPLGRSEARAAVIGGLIYFPGGFGGTNHLAAYDPAEDEWTPLKNMPANLDHHMVEAHGGKLYVFKGPTYAYDPATDTWESKTAGGHVRSDGTAVTVGDHIYVIGGQGVLPIERYAPATDTWEQLSSMGTVRGHVQAVLLNGKIWVLGGRAGNTMHKSVEIYDPAANTWTAGPDMHDFHTGHAAAVIDGRIIVAGGEIQTGSGPAIVKSVEVYDPAVGSWVRAKDMPTPLHGVASVAFGGKMYLLGGSYQPYAMDNSDQVFIYEPPSPGASIFRREAGFSSPDRAASGIPFRGRMIWLDPVRLDADGAPLGFRDALGKIVTGDGR